MASIQSAVGSLANSIFAATAIGAKAFRSMSERGDYMPRTPNKQPKEKPEERDKRPQSPILNEPTREQELQNLQMYRVLNQFDMEEKLSEQTTSYMRGLMEGRNMLKQKGNIEDEQSVV